MSDIIGIILIVALIGFVIAVVIASLVTTFLLPYWLWQQVFGDLSTNPYMIMYDYCIEHAARAAAGEDIIDELINAGVIEWYYEDLTCQDIHDIVVGR